MDIKTNYIEKLNVMDRDACFNLLTGSLDSKKLDLASAYSLIGSALAEVGSDATHDIWQEHVKTQIVRTSLELLTPYLLKEVPTHNGKKIAVVCPEGEYHELGARLVADTIRFFGFEPIYLGNSLPKHELLLLTQDVKLSAIALSVSNFYTLSAVNTMIADVNEKEADLPIILGGMAIVHNPDRVIGKNLKICMTLDELKTVLGALK